MGITRLLTVLLARNGSAIVSNIQYVLEIILKFGSGNNLKSYRRYIKYLVVCDSKHYNTWSIGEIDIVVDNQ